MKPLGWTSNLDTFSGICSSATRKIRLHLSLKDLWPILKRHTKNDFLARPKVWMFFNVCTTCNISYQSQYLYVPSMCHVIMVLHSTQDPPYSVHSCDGKDPPFVYLASREIRRRFPERSCHISLKLTAKVLQMGIKRTFHLPTTRCLGAKMLVSGRVRGFLSCQNIQELPIIVISW